MSDEKNPLLNAPSVNYQTLGDTEPASAQSALNRSPRHSAARAPDAANLPTSEADYDALDGDEVLFGSNVNPVVPDELVPLNQVYVHEVTDVGVGVVGGIPDRSVLVPPPEFQQLEQEFEEAISRDNEGVDQIPETYSVGSIRLDDEDELRHRRGVDTTFTFANNSNTISPPPLDTGSPKGYAVPLTGVGAALGGSQQKSQRAVSMGMGVRPRLAGSSGDLTSLRKKSSSNSVVRTAMSNDIKPSMNIDADAQTIMQIRAAPLPEQDEAESEEDDDDEDRPRGGGDATTIYPAPETVQKIERSQGNDVPLLSAPYTPGASDLKEPVNLGASNVSTSAPQPSPSRTLDVYRALLRHGNKLGEWRATAICGNDATGSIFYMAGPCISRAGCMAPVSVFIVSCVLYLFRSIYGEAVTALPLNGGAYNVLLNTTKKSTAAIAAVLTLLSYIATAVVSAAEAIQYLRRIVDFGDNVLLWGTIGLLLAFAILNFIGIGESANVALGIFILHLATLTLLLIVSLVAVCKRSFAVVEANWRDGPYGGVGEAVYYGFASAMLGVTGFETSANYVEEQKPGVYVKTLRNMWGLVSFFNILLTFCIIFIVDISGGITEHNAATIVADLARSVGGRWLEVVIVVDACLVLAGGVLTAYVGVTGLVRRLALDRCLPEFFLAQNKWRGTNHWIIFSFFMLCASMYVILKQNVQSLADTYSIAFMAVMSLFALGVMMLKVKRSTLQAEVTSTWVGAFLAFSAVIAGLVGIILQRPSIVSVFFLYFGVAWFIICTMFFRYQVLKLMNYFAQLFPCVCCKSAEGPVRRWIRNTMFDIRDRPMAFFAKRGKISVLNKAVQYVRENEDCSWLRIVHVFEREEDIPPTLYRNVRILNEQYPKMKIDLVLVKGRFSPAMVAYVSVKLGISRNHIFITTPQPGFEHKLDNLGGVRLITH